ncbi:DUF4845 domain-containing protein [Thioalkalivibrio denitrificans]|uniref:DUF4845 domain-containing protein n=1 Tax=Thioalkalivibrio denitrificans TaxID=108003 RepID=A0A1V3NQW3_9GAMM|nr:DUF4845 domain-containing protein [Thioalkalivibrio denitrificans]OOG27212.1 DUF4845 domain-containing protein [Thioalkalivibrio denitrificans]
MNELHGSGVHRQRGIALIPLLLIAAVLVIFGTVGLRLFPIYTEFMTVNSILKDIAAEGGAHSRSARELWGAADRRFQINSVDNVGRDHVTIEQRGEQRYLKLDYEVRTNMIANVDAVVRFEREYRLSQ